LFRIGLFGIFAKFIYYIFALTMPRRQAEQRKKRRKKMCTVSIKVNDNLLHKALGSMDNDVEIAEWMQQQIEAILIKMALATETKKRQDTVALDLAESKTDRQPIPDVVLSLLGAGLPLAEDDLNGREAYYRHLEEKHQ